MKNQKSLIEGLKIMHWVPLHEAGRMTGRRSGGSLKGFLRKAGVRELVLGGPDGVSLFYTDDLRLGPQAAHWLRNGFIEAQRHEDVPQSRPVTQSIRPSGTQSIRPAMGAACAKVLITQSTQPGRLLKDVLRESEDMPLFITEGTPIPLPAPVPPVPQECRFTEAERSAIGGIVKSVLLSVLKDRGIENAERVI